MKFTLDIQFFASKKGVSSTKNGRDSAGRRLGAKKADGEYTNASSAAVLMGISLRTVNRAVSTLKSKGLIAREGSNKNGSWRILLNQLA